MSKRKKKRHTRFSTTKTFPYPSVPATLSSDSSSGTMSPDDEEVIAHTPTTSLKTTPADKVTSTEPEEQETESQTHIVGRTKYDLLWNLRGKLNAYILLPFMYITVIAAFGQLKENVSSILLHGGTLLVIYIIIFIGGKFAKDVF